MSSIFIPILVVYSPGSRRTTVLHNHKHHRYTAFPLFIQYFLTTFSPFFSDLLQCYIVEYDLSCWTYSPLHCTTLHFGMLVERIFLSPGLWILNPVVRLTRQHTEFQNSWHFHGHLENEKGSAGRTSWSIIRIHSDFSNDSMQGYALWCIYFRFHGWMLHIHQ